MKSNKVEGHQGSTLWGPSGGLVWHGRALRYRRRWHTLLTSIEQCLAQWQPPGERLLLVGPSAGWCLPGGFLTRFQRVHGIDLDPLAHAAFYMNHGRALRRADVPLTWETGDFWPRLDEGTLADRQTVVLFCNVLGQHALHRRHPDLALRDLERLPNALQGRAWGSFHDRLSGPWTGDLPSPDAFTSESSVPNLELASRAPTCRSWCDHLTEGLLPEGTRRWFIPWMINPTRFHWVEAGFFHA